MSGNSYLPCSCDEVEDTHAAGCEAAMTAEEQLEYLADLSNIATPGPWEVETSSGYITGHVIAKAHSYSGSTDGRRDSVCAPESMTVTDATFIAIARHALPALVETVRREAASSVRAEAPGRICGEMLPVTSGTTAGSALGWPAPRPLYICTRPEPCPEHGSG